ncbi:MAG: hypothetical protein LBR41_00915, partial [Rickettsiales bacterium]|nr:hypothetical protein [Rickettsiales bacterium]
MNTFQPIDGTQNALFPWIARTEQIIEHVLHKLDANSWVEITPTIDMGITPDIFRIAGGFTAGMSLEWDCHIPFVPVDTTVDACASSYHIFPREYLNFVMNRRITKKHLHSVRLRAKRQHSMKTGFKGNHFISVGEIDENTAALALHFESWKKADEVYLRPGCWYWNDIKVEQMPDGRYLRYITGKTAQEFYKRHERQKSESRRIHDYYTEQIIGDFPRLDEGFYIHSGMKTPQHIRIGCFLE